MKITVKLPINVNKKEYKIFNRRKEYKQPKLKILHKRNVFFTHYGIALKRLFFLNKTLPNKWGLKKPNGMFGLKFYRKAIETYFVCKFGSSLKYKVLDDAVNYLFIYSPWFGYFSWITESLPRIIMVVDELSVLTLVLPESYMKRGFVVESLRMFPELKIEVIPKDVHFKIPNVIIPQLKPWTYEFIPLQMEKLRGFVWKYLETLDMKIRTYEKIYVSRKKAKNRKIQNEEDVVAVFLNNGFKIIEFEDYSFFEQVYLMQNCKILAGIHGAGFANIAFMKSGSSVLELIKEYSSYKEERPSYWRLSSALNINYYIQYCKPVKYGNYDTWVSVDLIVDIPLLKRNLTLILDNNNNK